MTEWCKYKQRVEPLRDDLIVGVEKIIQFVFPHDYKECVKFNHGTQPVKDDLIIYVSGKPWNIGFGQLLTLDPLKSNSNVMNKLSILRTVHDFPNTLVPIVVGGCGDYLCLDYSESKDRPKVTFYFHELELPEALYHVADSFSDMLEMLTVEENV